MFYVYLSIIEKIEDSRSVHSLYFYVCTYTMCRNFVEYGLNARLFYEVAKSVLYEKYARY